MLEIARPVDTVYNKYTSQGVTHAVTRYDDTLVRLILSRVIGKYVRSEG